MIPYSSFSRVLPLDPDYQENRLSLDQHCNTGAPGVFFFRSDTYSFREGIKPGALLIVDFGGTPVDGSLVLGSEVQPCEKPR